MPEVKKNWVVVKCPHCGAEYLPAEIFMPEDFTGTPDSVVKDAAGKILYADYIEDEEPCAKESFVCDNCGKPFTVEPIISYKVGKQAEEFDFSSEEVSLLD